MDMSLVEKLAVEYVRLVDEGWSPNLDEFLGRVPTRLREPCRLQIEGLMSVAEEIAQVDADEESEAPDTSFLTSPEPVGAETIDEVEWLSEGTEDAVSEPAAAAEPEVVDEPAAVAASVEPPAAPSGPQRLSKEEAMAMWDTQLDRS